MSWQPEVTAPAGRPVLVCDQKDGYPYTIANAETRGFRTWYYVGTVEQLDFVPEFWMEAKVDRNPFDIAVPAPPIINLVED